MSLEDKESITSLLTQFCHAVDADDVTWVDMFTDDGVMSLTNGRIIAGREALKEYAANQHADGSLHLWANPVIDIDGDEATCTSYVFVVRGQGDPRIDKAARYSDRLRRVDGDWRLAERRIEPLLR